MQLMDLPFDMLQEIFFKVMSLCWSGIDFALCNRQTMELLHANRHGILHYLHHRPWFIYNGTMHAEVEDVLGDIEDHRCLHHGARYLELGWVRKLELKCSSVQYASDGSILRDELVTDWALEYALGNWPSNKVVLVYDMH